MFRFNRGKLIFWQLFDKCPIPLSQSFRCKPTHLWLCSSNVTHSWDRHIFQWQFCSFGTVPACSASIDTGTWDTIFRPGCNGGGYPAGVCNNCIPLSFFYKGLRTERAKFVQFFSTPLFMKSNNIVMWFNAIELGQISKAYQYVNKYSRHKHVLGRLWALLLMDASFKLFDGNFCQSCWWNFWEYYREMAGIGTFVRILCTSLHYTSDSLFYLDGINFNHR